jgi:hypothetical protein
LSLSDIFARAVELVGGTALLSRRLVDGSHEPAWGSAPLIPAGKPQGRVPTLKMPTAKGWTEGRTPVAAQRLRVNAFATGLDHPRWIEVLPNGDVLVAEAMTVGRAVMRSLFDYAMFSTMRRADAVGVSANRITLLRDADGDGVAESREVFLKGLNQPFGMALVGDTFYVGNTDALIAFPYTMGESRIAAPGQSSQSSSPVGIGPAACCRAPMAESSISVSARPVISRRMAWPPRRAGPPFTSSTLPAAKFASLPAACATPSVWPGSRTLVRSGPWSTSA